jgi:hypothetical protein
VGLRQRGWEETATRVPQHPTRRRRPPWVGCSDGRPLLDTHLTKAVEAGRFPG